MKNQEGLVESQQDWKPWRYREERQQPKQREAMGCSGYELGRSLGKGSFGVVVEGRCPLTGKHVAIKRVLQDARYKNRELHIMKMLNHPNIVSLVDYFYTQESLPCKECYKQKPKKTRYLNVVMEKLPSSLDNVINIASSTLHGFPLLLVRLYTYQLCRGLGYLHSLGICHRDIKPHNILVNLSTHVIKLCDFGSAKYLKSNEPSVTYICSRYYRAPELILGATDYTTAVDIWSLGCVFAELLTGKPLFKGKTSIDQMVKIIQTLGTPATEDLKAMNGLCENHTFPYVPPKPPFSILVVPSWKINENPEAYELALDLLASFLQYNPQKRLTPYEALLHPFFSPLHACNLILPNGDLAPLSNCFPKDIQHKHPPSNTVAIASYSTPRNASCTTSTTACTVSCNALCDRPSCGSCTTCVRTL